MNRLVTATVIAVGSISVYAPSLLAQQSKAPPAANSQRIAACSLLPKAEVKKHFPWNDLVDDMPPEEQPIRTSGSSCNYPTVFIQVWPGSVSKPQEEGMVPVSGVGREAWFHNNRDRYAELVVNTERHVLTLQASVPDGGTIEMAKQRIVNLAKAYLAKLP